VKDEGVTMQCSRIRDEVLAAEKMEVLYGEADPEARERVSTHLRECPACREEMAALRDVRARLGAWTLPRRPGRGVVSAPRGIAQWLLLAAVIVLAVGMGVALHGQSSLRQQLRQQRVQALERDRAQAEQIAALRAAVSRSPRTGDDAPLLARLDERLDSRIRQSEAKQDRRLGEAFAEWGARTEAQRRVDLARIAAGLSYLDGRHGQQLARTNELMGYVLESASAKGGDR
jgi:anti-sigma factor RsiW